MEKLIAMTTYFSPYIGLSYVNIVKELNLYIVAYFCIKVNRTVTKCLYSKGSRTKIALDARRVNFFRPKCTNSTLREKKIHTTKQMK